MMGTQLPRGVRPWNEFASASNRKTIKYGGSHALPSVIDGCGQDSVRAK
jgi:hypothetical protein